jgi:Tol biopolymer transport system component
MNVDVSPDGSMIAFRHAGRHIHDADIWWNSDFHSYRLAWEVQPRWSPDGKKILFTSDSAGGDNIFLYGCRWQKCKTNHQRKFQIAQ